MEALEERRNVVEESGNLNALLKCVQLCCVKFFFYLYIHFLINSLSDVSDGDTSQQENILEQFPEPYDGDSSNNDSSDDNTSNSENEVEQHGFYEYSGMEAMMQTGIHIILFIRFIS